MRLNKYLALCGVDSRRKCDTLILKKKIKVNGKVVGDFSYRVQKDDLVQYKNSVVSPQDDYKFYLINKPSGYVCSSSPSDGKRVIDLIPSKRRLFTIGRLDRDTTGAIIVTDNGDVANKFMHPKYKIEKIYIAESKMDIDRKIYGNLISRVASAAFPQHTPSANLKPPKRQKPIVVFASSHFRRHTVFNLF